jgi:protoheme IX farnesyltransferase
MKNIAAEMIPAAGWLCCRMRERLGSCLLLAKPGIVALVTLTGFSALVIEGSLLADSRRLVGVLLGILLSACGANGLNQIWDRDIDAVMDRTRSRRPIPAGKISASGALWLSLSWGFLGIWLLKTAGSTLSALLGIGTILFYLFVYTIWLKRRTPLNIVIGGAAGAAAPLICWSAGANTLEPLPLLMFMVIFLWSPPHFWSLALCRKEEYARAGIPMLPVVAGEKRTRLQITAYVVLLLPVTGFLGIRADLGWLFLLGTSLLGMNMIRKVILLNRRKDRLSAQAFFNYSIVYLAAVFGLMLLR